MEEIVYYKEALKIYTEFVETENFADLYLCNVLTELYCDHNNLSFLGSHTPVLKVNFPLFVKHKPKDRTFGESWFNTQNHVLANSCRINLLTKIIQEYETANK